LKKLLQQVLRRNAYFILAAAWLFTIAFIINNYWANFNSIGYLRDSIEKGIRKKEADFNELIQDTALLRKLSNDRFNNEELEEIVNKPYGVFLYNADTYGQIAFKFWNTQTAEPTTEMLNGDSLNGYVRLPSGYYEYITRQVNLNNKNKVVVIGLIPVYRQFFIQSSSLKKGFVDHPKAEAKIEITQNPEDFPVKSSYGNTLFYLHPKPDSPKETETYWLSLTLTLIGILFLLIFIHNMAVAIAAAYEYLHGIGFLVVVLIILRGLTYVFPQWLNLKQYDLFEPRIYSSGYILNSLGDLLINSFLVCWMVLFIRKVIEKKTLSNLKNTPFHWPVLVTGVGFLVGITFGAASLIKGLISNGTISFNVTNFFTLDVYSFLGFLGLANIAFAYFFLSRIILRSLRHFVENRKYLIFLLIAAFGLTILTLIQRTSDVELYIHALGWLLLYTWLMQKRVISGLYSRLNISIVLFWLFIFSFSISVIIIYENEKKELDQRKRTAGKLSEKADPSRERLLNIAFIYFDDEFLFSNFERFKNATSNSLLKDSLSNKNFSPYLDIFETKIYTFDSDKSPLFNEEPVSYDTLNTVYSIEGKPTSVTNLRFFEKAFDEFAYIFRREVKDTSNKTIGYFFIRSDPKRYKTDALVPELFRRDKKLLPEYSPIYSYAIYNKLRLIDYYNNYQFPTHLKRSDVPKNEFSHVKNNGYDELWYKYGVDNVVVFARIDNYFLEAITLFAYIFSSFLLLVAIFSIIMLLIRSRLRWGSIKLFWQFNIRSQIHGTIIFISLFSFLVIGIATVFFFNNRYEKNNQERLSKAIQIMSSDIQKKIRSQEGLGDKTEQFAKVSEGVLKTLLNEVAEIHGAEVNYYDLRGNLFVSTNMDIYSEGILSRKMNPVAYYYMNNEHLVQYINHEEVGDVKFQSIYSPVINDEGTAVAYLNIPSFISQEELKREISNFLVTIINLNAFIFLVAGVIALFITNRITSSFLLIGHKMREINLGKLNEEISWNREDEIGGLVKEYNKMVVKLGESALALAKSEREGAWREMARQVAHEIKNPLTPMKLSIQYLQKSINNNSSNVKELSANVARTLIEQIDHLTKIANDFSQFANIGNVKNELFNLQDLLHSLSSLYESTQNLDFKWIPLKERIFVMADRTQLNRLFTNLFQNAVEACQSKDNCIITITEELHDDKVVIKVIDNGEGIPEGMQSRIFTPNFTTKSSGTGLGLAMSKTIVEQAKGRIWFETVEGEGTTFFIELPVIRNVS
jgi:signal transduction histidine kinase